MQGAKKVEWEAWVDACDRVDKRYGANWITVGQFAKLANTHTDYVHKACLAAVIKKESCCVLRAKNKARQVRFFIDWNACGYAFIMSQPRSRWPLDFEVNEQQEFNLIDSDYKSKKQFVDTDAVDTVTSVAAIRSINNISDARLQAKKLEVLEKLIGNKIANNESIDVEAVLNAGHAIAYEIKSAMQKFIAYAAPAVVPCDTVQAATVILEAHMQDILKTLLPLLLTSTYLGKESNDGEIATWETEETPID